MITSFDWVFWLILAVLWRRLWTGELTRWDKAARAMCFVAAAVGFIANYPEMRQMVVAIFT